MSDEGQADVIGLGYGQLRLSLKERIEARVVVLEAWRDHGVPEGRPIPKSLAAVRRWSAPELGIYPIGSPNGFTLTDPVHGKAVSRILAAITAILAAYPAAASGQTQESETQPRQDLTRIVSQWHSERALAQDLARQRLVDATNYLRDTAALRARIEELEGTVADLTRKVSGSAGLRIVE